MNFIFRKPEFPFQAAALSCWLGVAILFTGANSRAAQTSSGTSRNDYSEFKVIPDRNIFNPKRSAGRTAVERPRETRRTSYTRSESFALVGTMSYAKGPFAFFDSSTSSYRKVVSANDSIADCKVLLVDPAFVKLECGTNLIDLPVGKQLVRQEGAWKVTDRIEVSDSRGSYGSRDHSDRRERSANGSTGQAGSAPEPSGGDTPPIIVINGGDSAPDMALPAPDTAGGAPPAPGVSPPPQPGGDILEILRQRAARERGE